ncbi:MAG: hypothetical protein SF097_16430 [Acidobacteriota bacterium]|nr:hypothetical protein [Acidobacteriota bacterium]
MMSTMQLEAKLIWLRTQVDEALQDVGQKKQFEALTPEEWWDIRMKRVRTENESLSPLLEQAFEALSATETPIGAEQVQQLVATCGVNPNGNSFSQGLIEMREEKAQ